MLYHFVRKVRMWDGEVGCSNPSGSRLDFCGRQNLTFDKGWAWMPEVERPKALSTDAYKWSQKVGAGRTDRKRPRLQRTQSQQSVHMARVMVQSEGWLSFYNDSGNGSIRCNGRGKPLALRKVSGIVRFWKGWCEARGLNLM